MKPSKRIRDLMSANVQVAHPGATLQEAARMMRSLDVGALPVCEDERLVGLITDRDIVVRAVALGLDPAEEIVATVMSMPAVYCFEDQTVEEASRIMEEKQIRRIAVLDRDKRLVGILALGDLAVDLDSEDFATEILEQVSEPPHERKAA